MKYIGSQPDLDIIGISRFDYIEPNNPSISLNPSYGFANFLNSVSGEEFHCIDSTAGSNKWAGNLGTTIEP